MLASSEETASLLRRARLFAALSDDDRALVAAIAVPRRYEAGEVVFREGDESDTCYIVGSGRARAVREHPDGRSITLANFGPGDIFGELAVLDAERRSATVEAVETTEATAILGGDMRRLLREHPGLAQAMLSALAERLRDTTDRLARQSFQTVQSRVASVLADLARAQCDGEAAGTDIEITSTQADLARLAGASRESTSRFLAVLERAGVITQGRGRLVVHGADAMERYIY